MKVGGVVFLMMTSACGGSPPSKPPVSPPQKAGHRELYCPEGELKPSLLASKDPSEGGYRRLPDEIALQTVRGAIPMMSMSSTKSDQAPSALVSAIHDMRDEIRACMKQADTVVPNLQYFLNVTLLGSGAGTIVDGVSLKRIDGRSPGGSSREVATTAEPCIASLVQLLELPPSSGRSGVGLILRYDFCTPAYDVGTTIAQEYARAFPAWAAAHPGMACPSQLTDLHPYMHGVKDTQDPWGQPFRLRCKADVLEVWSAGRDGKPDTPDDVTSWR